ncbi:MAG: ATP phosphoribosyltransferase regulatory subunit, partial [Chitinispirillaceae bacterium]|nr:ATP phosphoribosyltransferase regulatory subunit [Chitinispirillaceae bacterium]
DMMRDLGLTAADFKVRISSRTLVDELFAAAGLEAGQRSAVFAHLDKKSKLPPSVFEERLAAAVPDSAMRDRIERVLAARSLDELVNGGNIPPSLEPLRQLFALLSAYGLDDYAVFDIGVVRGLAYYTGIVFELFDAAGSMRAIAGGGRYDRLVEQYGGPVTPAVGFAAGDVVLADLLREKGIVPPRPGRCDCFIITFSDDQPGEVITLARELRRAGISCEFALKRANPGKQMKLANAARAMVALFIGGEESNVGMIKVKNMGTGDECLVPRTAIASRMRELTVPGGR